MSKKQWSALLCLHVAYLFLGASIFYHIESPLELENKLEELRERIEIESKKALLIHFIFYRALTINHSTYNNKTVEGSILSNVFRHTFLSC